MEGRKKRYLIEPGKMDERDFGFEIFAGVHGAFEPREGVGDRGND